MIDVAKVISLARIAKGAADIVNGVFDIIGNQSTAQGFDANQVRQLGETLRILEAEETEVLIRRQEAVDALRRCNDAALAESIQTAVELLDNQLRSINGAINQLRDVKNTLVSNGFGENAAVPLLGNPFRFP